MLLQKPQIACYLFFFIFLLIIFNNSMNSLLIKIRFKIYQTIVETQFLWPDFSTKRTKQNLMSIPTHCNFSQIFLKLDVLATVCVFVFLILNEVHKYHRDLKQFEISWLFLFCFFIYSAKTDDR